MRKYLSGFFLFFLDDWLASVSPGLVQSPEVVLAGGFVRIRRVCRAGWGFSGSLSFTWGFRRSRNGEGERLRNTQKKNPTGSYL